MHPANSEGFQVKDYNLSITKQKSFYYILCSLRFLESLSSMLMFEFPCLAPKIDPAMMHNLSIFFGL